MQTKRYDLAQTDGWVAITDEATQVLVQLRTNGNVELVLSENQPTTAALQGILLTSSAFPVFSATGLVVTDIVWARLLGKDTDTDSITVLDNGLAP
jgi:hypothetical protein